MIHNGEISPYTKDVFLEIKFYKAQSFAFLCARIDTLTSSKPVISRGELLLWWMTSKGNLNRKRKKHENHALGLSRSNNCGFKATATIIRRNTITSGSPKHKK